MHPGGLAALTDEEVGAWRTYLKWPNQLNMGSAGQDATDQFFSLHRWEVLTKPQYQRLIIGTIEGEESSLHAPNIGDLSKVPYAEPTWLNEGYYSPYFTEVCCFSLIPHLLAYLSFQYIESSGTSESNAQIRRWVSSAWCPGACISAFCIWISFNSAFYSLERKMVRDQTRKCSIRWRTSALLRRTKLVNS